MKAGQEYTALPSEGYQGEIPRFPLPEVNVFDVYFVDKKRVKEYDASGSEIRREREAELWEWAWRTPMAKAWAREPWRWHTVAMWVRTAAMCEASDATAADKNSLHRFADQIGLTPAGLKENGWAVSRDAMAEKREEAAPEAGTSARDRLRLA
jgi:hypothetical protein